MNQAGMPSQEELEKTKTGIKGLLKKLKGSADPSVIEGVKSEFSSILQKAHPFAIAMAEQEMLKEGYTFDDLKTACDVHLELFKGAIENSFLKLPADHPISRFQDEHKAIIDWLKILRAKISEARGKPGWYEAGPQIEEISRIAQKLMGAEIHNVRQENTLFPVLEKHGVTAPPSIMWAEHTEMKEQKKEFARELAALTADNFSPVMANLDSVARQLMEKFLSHTQKETHVLYQTAVQVITDDEWKDIREECDSLGYFNLEQQV